MENVVVNSNKKLGLSINNVTNKKQENPINVMQRYELKYILTNEQIDYLVYALKGYMEIDKYGKTSIQSLYYDTKDYRLIRLSLEKPEFKEKLRLRSYGLASKDSQVFLELKRKAYDIVYKRRETMKIDEVCKFMNYDYCIDDNQIGKELTYFRNYYKELVPACLIIYDRVAYYQKDGDLRLTIDYNPRYRFDNLNLTTSTKGTSLLKNGGAILEVKVQGAIPLWLTKILNEGKIYKGTFSKYGEAYKRKVLEERMCRYV